MVYPVRLRFLPTDEEIVDHYLRLKNLGGSTSLVDQVISAVNICSFDPLDLPSQSRMESNDQVWYFFGRKKRKYNRGEQQSRKTKSGFWKKTGVTTNIMRRGQKIGEKKVLVFQYTTKTPEISGSKSKSDWVMHEYVATLLSPNQMMTYTLCKVMFKGDERDLSSSGGGEIEHNQSLITHMNYSGGVDEGSSFDCLHSQE